MQKGMVRSQKFEWIFVTAAAAEIPESVLSGAKQASRRSSGAFLLFSPYPPS
jgi:protein-L-isoaspartate O-methyltransferase